VFEKVSGCERNSLLLQEGGDEQGSGFFLRRKVCSRGEESGDVIEEKKNFVAYQEANGESIQALKKRGFFGKWMKRKRGD